MILLPFCVRKSNKIGHNSPDFSLIMHAANVVYSHRVLLRRNITGAEFPPTPLPFVHPVHETLITRRGVNKINGERGASNVTAVRRRINTKINKNADTNASINPCGQCVCVVELRFRRVFTPCVPWRSKDRVHH